MEDDQLLSALFGDPWLSYHSPMVLKLADVENSGPKPFKFFNHWNKNEEFFL